VTDRPVLSDPVLRSMSGCLMHESAIVGCEPCDYLMTQGRAVESAVVRELAQGVDVDLSTRPTSARRGSPMAGDDVLSDEQVHNFVEQLEVCRSLDDDKRVVLAAARLAQQRERERLAAAAGDAAERVGHAPLCDWGLGACSCGSIDAIAALQARHEAEVRELRAAAEDAVPWGPANEALKWLVKFGRTEHSSALLEICDGSTVELLDCIGRLHAALSTKAGGA
jgi:hypothetical protein